MVAIALKDLLEAGVHFGHQTKRWNPKMKEYIFGERNGIYILDLGKTLKLVRDAEEFVSNLAAEGRTILFVGTKRQAKDVIAEEAVRCGMFFVNERWLGGLLTNFATIQRSLGRLRDIEAMATDGRYDTLSKKEIARNEKERRKLHKNLEGIRGMSRLPSISTRTRPTLAVGAVTTISTRSPRPAAQTLPRSASSCMKATSPRPAAAEESRALR